MLVRTKRMYFRFDGSPEVECQARANDSVDAIFNRRKDNDNDAHQEDDNFERRDLPELIHCVRRSDQIANRVDDHCGETCGRGHQRALAACILLILTSGWYIKEDWREGVNGK